MRIKKKKNKNKHIVLFSGGTDSTAVVSYLLEIQQIPKDSVIALTFKVSSAQNKEELRTARKLVKHFGVEHLVIPLEVSYGKGRLLKGRGKGMKSPKNLVVPFRNLLFFTKAMNWLLSEGYQGVLYCGSHKGSAFVDNSPKVIRYMEKVIGLCSGGRFSLETPLLKTTKPEIAAHLLHTGLLPHTYSCYTGKKSHCGKCHACKGRVIL